MVIHTWVFADIFSKMKKVSLSVSGKELIIFVPVIKFESLNKN